MTLKGVGATNKSRPIDHMLNGPRCSKTLLQERSQNFSREKAHAQEGELVHIKGDGCAFVGELKPRSPMTTPLIGWILIAVFEWPWTEVWHVTLCHAFLFAHWLPIFQKFSKVLYRRIFRWSFLFAKPSILKTEARLWKLKRLIRLEDAWQRKFPYLQALDWVIFLHASLGKKRFGTIYFSPPPSNIADLKISARWAINVWKGMTKRDISHFRRRLFENRNWLQYIWCRRHDTPSCTVCWKFSQRRRSSSRTTAPPKKGASYLNKLVNWLTFNRKSRFEKTTIYFWCDGLAHPLIVKIYGFMSCFEKCNYFFDFAPKGKEKENRISY